MFIIARVAVGCIVFVVLNVFIAKNSTKRKRAWRLVSVIVSVLLISALYFLPLENLFMTFDSPQEVYRYVNVGKENIELMVEGESSTLIVGCQNDTYRHSIIPKTTKGWKLGTSVQTKKIFQKVSDEILIEVYQYKDTSDYYIAVLSFTGGALEIIDSDNSVFYSLEKENDFQENTFVSYYAYTSRFDSQYCLTVDGIKYSFAN